MKIAKRMKMMKIMKYNSYMEVKKIFFLKLHNASQQTNNVSFFGRMPFKQ